MKITPLILHTLLGIALLGTALWWLPMDTALWRKALVCILSVTLGYHIATAMISAPAKGRVWLECLAFPMMMLGILSVPAPMGWVLVVVGLFWRALVGRVLVE